MSTWFILLIIALVVVAFIVYRLASVRKASREISRKRFERIQPLFDNLESGKTLTPADVYDYARNLLTRETTFRLLDEYGLSDLFPAEYYTIEKGGEANLAGWLEFPTELDACPDEIEHVKRVTIDFDGQNNFVYYHVYKFRVNEPHWAAKDGWMIGVVGPYFDDSKPYDHPHSTFSRLSSKFETTAPDEEARWVHEHISMQR